MKSTYLQRVLTAIVAFAAFAGTVHGEERLTFTVVGIDCDACAPPILRALKGVAGIRNAGLDWKACRDRGGP